MSKLAHCVVVVVAVAVLGVPVPGAAQDEARIDSACPPSVWQNRLRNTQDAGQAQNVVDLYNECLLGVVSGVHGVAVPSEGASGPVGSPPPPGGSPEILDSALFDSLGSDEWSDAAASRAAAIEAGAELRELDRSGASVDDQRRARERFRELSDAFQADWSASNQAAGAAAAASGALGAARAEESARLAEVAARNEEARVAWQTARSYRAWADQRDTEAAEQARQRAAAEVARRMLRRCEAGGGPVSSAPGP